MKLSVFVSIAMFALVSVNSFAGCEDGESIAASAAIDLAAQNDQSVVENCTAVAEFMSNSNEGDEIYVAYMSCNNGDLRLFKIILEEYEDAVCGVKSVEEL